MDFPTCHVQKLSATGRAIFIDAINRIVCRPNVFPKSFAGPSCDSRAEYLGCATRPTIFCRRRGLLATFWCSESHSADYLGICWYQNKLMVAPRIPTLSPARKASKKFFFIRFLNPVSSQHWPEQPSFSVVYPDRYCFPRTIKLTGAPKVLLCSF